MALIIGEIFGSGIAPSGLPSLNMITVNGSGVIRGMVSGISRPLLGFDHNALVSANFITSGWFTPYPLKVFKDFSIQRADRIINVVNILTNIWQANNNKPPFFKPPLTELNDEITYSDYLDNSGFPDKLILFNCAIRSIESGTGLNALLNIYKNGLANFFHPMMRGDYAFSNPVFVMDFIRTQYLRPFLIENNILNPDIGRPNLENK
jgi:hypothetical protein